MDVSELRRQLDDHPELWNQHPARLAPGGPFDETSDLWVRFRDPSELTSIEAYADPHFPIFYPSWHVLTALHAIVWNVMYLEHATMLGGILITKIPAGSRVKPHHDRGRWHAEFFNRKIYIPVKANSRCINYCGDESVVMKTGDAWHFDNLQIHSVVNEGDEERITVIICIRTEP